MAVEKFPDPLFVGAARGSERASVARVGYDPELLRLSGGAIEPSPVFRRYETVPLSRNDQEGFGSKLHDNAFRIHVLDTGLEIELIAQDGKIQKGKRS